MMSWVGTSIVMVRMSMRYTVYERDHDPEPRLEDAGQTTEGEDDTPVILMDDIDR